MTTSPEITAMMIAIADSDTGVHASSNRRLCRLYEDGATG
jgi:hypothetical protein